MVLLFVEVAIILSIGLRWVLQQTIEDAAPLVIGVRLVRRRAPTSRTGIRLVVAVLERFQCRPVSRLARRQSLRSVDPLRGLSVRRTYEGLLVVIIEESSE